MCEAVVWYGCYPDQRCRFRPLYVSLSLWNVFTRYLAWIRMAHRQYQEELLEDVAHTRLHTWKGISSFWWPRNNSRAFLYRYSWIDCLCQVVPSWKVSSHCLQSSCKIEKQSSHSLHKEAPQDSVSWIQVLHLVWILDLVDKASQKPGNLASGEVLRKANDWYSSQTSRKGIPNQLIFLAICWSCLAFLMKVFCESLYRNLFWQNSDF